MHDTQYMFPSEFAALIAFLFALPLLLAFAAQTWLFAAHRMFTDGFLGLAITGYVATVFGSLVVGAAISQFAPRFLKPALHVRDVAIGSQSWPIMPLAFFSVAIAAGLVSWRILSRVKALEKGRDAK